MGEREIEAMAGALGIPIVPEWVEAIGVNLRVSVAMGAVVGEMALGDEVELAPVYQP